MPEIAAAYSVSRAVPVQDSPAARGKPDDRDRAGPAMAVIRLARAASRIIYASSKWCAPTERDCCPWRSVLKTIPPSVPLVDSCALNEALRKALGAFFEVLESYTIEDLARNRPNLRHLLKIEDGPAAIRAN